MNSSVTILQGDCLARMKEIPDKSIDMVLCDMPYGITHCSWDSPLDLSEVWTQYRRITKEHAAIVLMGKQPFTTDLIQSNRKMWRYNLVWLKNRGVGWLNAKVMPLQQHEDICVFYDHMPTYNPQMDDGFERKVSKASRKRKCKAAEIYGKAVCLTDYDSTKRYPISVIYFEKDQHTVHPTQKPVALMEWLIRTYTNEGDVVLDNCMGSGSTGVACVNTRRKFIGIEIDSGYVDIANERIHKAMEGER